MMSELGPRRFVAWSGATALAAGLVLLPFLAPRGSQILLSGLLGWLAMSVVGVAGGWWLVARHGSAAAAFLRAMGICMLARLVVAAAGAFGARAVGAAPAYAYLAGLAAGYLPVQALEMVWFLRRDRFHAATDERGNGR